MDAFSVEAAAKRLGVSKFTVRMLIRQRRLEHFRIGRRIVLSESAVESFLDRHRVPAREERPR